MRSGARAADGNPLATEIFRLLNVGARVEPVVELLMKIGDADQIGAAHPGVDEMAGADNRRVDLAGDQCCHRQGIPRHENELHIDAMLFKYAAVPRHPDMSHAFTGYAGGKV